MMTPILAGLVGFLVMRPFGNISQKRLGRAKQNLLET